MNEEKIEKSANEEKSKIVYVIVRPLSIFVVFLLIISIALQFIVPGIVVKILLCLQTVFCILAWFFGTKFCG